MTAAPTLAIETSGTGRTVSLKLRLGDRVLAVDDANPRRAPVRAGLRTSWGTLLEGHLRAIGRTTTELAEWLDGELLRIADELTEKDRIDPASEKAGQGTAMSFEVTEPWPDAVDGAQVLDEVRSTFGRFLAMSEDSSQTVALWVGHCWSIDSLNYSPRLNVTAPTKRAGKSTLLEVLGCLAPRPFHVASISGAALARVVEEHRPTLLLDEADAWLDENEELRGIVNAGCRPTGAIVRCVGDDSEPRLFSCYGPVALAGIGRRRDTIVDRSVSIELRRKTAADRVESVRLDRLPGELKAVRRRLARFSLDTGALLRASDPALPPGVTNRLADVWRGLVAIADLAGGHWPATSRRIAAGIASTADDAQDSLGVLLLADLRDAFGDREPEAKLTTETILGTLNAQAERPWPTLAKGRPIDARRLARLLEPFGIRSSTVRVGAETAKGYLRGDLSDAFARYLSGGGVCDPSHRHTPTAAGPGGQNASVTLLPGVTDRIAPQPPPLLGCDAVTDRNTLEPRVPQREDQVSEFERLLESGGAA